MDSIELLTQLKLVSVNYKEYFKNSLEGKVYGGKIIVGLYKISLSDDEDFTGIARVNVNEREIELNQGLIDKYNSDTIFYTLVWCYMRRDLDDADIDADNESIQLIKNNLPDFNFYNISIDMLTELAISSGEKRVENIMVKMYSKPPLTNT